ncbi:sensor histidine kinase [Pseudomonas panipatensis]|uniref:histidine kinase n=1 Tax=Pseudomonas panipatensis TaxID=428992 RepID=A0A1G8MNM0_9PSED|nr:HAMP domain-containing sensor histidine kinase [Pseudomonas panipatensis]SDI69619.1 Signal transduction histidine kinase [Pseudomonas panipatensis]SMP77638.1 Signal transduction histidine kinase [Pseudomonas panipatensis]
MSLPNPSEGWRSSSSRLLALYSFLFIAWGSLLMGILYWEVSSSLDSLSAHSLISRANLFSRFEGDKLDAALSTGQVFDERVNDAYGLFDRNGLPISGKIHHIPLNLKRDGQVHRLKRCDRMIDGSQLRSSCYALLVHADNGRLLVLVRDNGSLSAVTRIILHALLWGISLTLIPGIIGWHLLRRRPQRRIQRIQRCAAAIIAGDLERRLPLSQRRDELDMLAAIVNGMLDRIVQLMQEVKGVCDSIAHDLRTPLTHLRTQLHRLQQQIDSPPQSTQLERIIGETDSLMLRFHALLRISELEDHRRRSSFDDLQPLPLLRELHEFYLPLAEERRQSLTLECVEQLPGFRGDRALLFEAFGNLLGNAIKFTPEGGHIVLRATERNGFCCIEVLDSGPGVPLEERQAVFQRLFRGRQGVAQSGFGLGLSIVSAILNLHGYPYQLGKSLLGGACFSIYCHPGSSLD